MLKQALEEQETETRMNKMARGIDDTTQSNNINNPVNDNFKEVMSRKKQRSHNKQQTGTAKVEKNGDDEFKSITDEKKLWLFLKKAKDSVTENTVKNYIKRKTNCDDNEITVQCVKDKTKFNKNCFLVGIKPDLKDLAYNSTFWPEGIEFSRFDFKRGQHFLDHPRKQMQPVR